LLNSPETQRSPAGSIIAGGAFQKVWQTGSCGAGARLIKPWFRSCFSPLLFIDGQQLSGIPDIRVFFHTYQE